MKFRNKYYDAILDYGLKEFEHKEKLVLEKEDKKIPFTIKPHQEFKLWNTRIGPELFLTSFLVLLLLAAVYGLLFLFGFVGLRFTGNPTSFEEQKLLYIIPFLLSLGVLGMFIYFDVKDFIFRKGTSYSFLKEGITFNQEKTFLLEWKQIKSIEGDKTDDKIFFKLKTKNKNEKKVLDLYIEPGEDYDFIFKLISRMMKLKKR